VTTIDPTKTPDGKYLWPEDENEIVRFADEPDSSKTYRRFAGLLKATLFQHTNSSPPMVSKTGKPYHQSNIFMLRLEIRDTRKTDRYLVVTLSPTAILRAMMLHTEQKCILRWYKSIWNQFEPHVTAEGIQEFENVKDDLAAWLDADDGTDSARLRAAMAGLVYEGPGLALADDTYEPESDADGGVPSGTDNVEEPDDSSVRSKRPLGD